MKHLKIETVMSLSAVDQCQVIGYEAKRKKESLNKSVIIDSESDSWKRRQERILYLDIN
ncbi:hypothetical protein YC2023_124609 [Brassica napus]